MSGHQHTRDARATRHVLLAVAVTAIWVVGTLLVLHLTGMTEVSH